MYICTMYNEISIKNDLKDIIYIYILISLHINRFPVDDTLFFFLFFFFLFDDGSDEGCFDIFDTFGRYGSYGSFGS